MTRTNRLSSPAPSSSQPSVRLKAKGRTRLARRIDRFLLRITEPIDVVGSYLLGDWWRPIILAIQDAIAIGCLLWIPNTLFKLASLGKDFSELQSCWQISVSDPSFVACIGVVSGEYCFWMLFAGRTIARFINQVRHK